MHVLFLFIDGIGLGPDRAETNPFASLRLPAFERLAAGRRWTDDAPPVTEDALVFRHLDANLGLEGLPQSGTGQATLFTGINCAEIAGRHYGPFPHSETKSVIAAHNLFRRIDALDPNDPEPAAFANAYPERFFRYMRRRDRWTVTTRCCLHARTRLRGRDDLLAGLALPADVLGEGWPEPSEPGLMPRDVREAATRLLNLTARRRLTLFETFMTDKAGHSQSFERATEVLVLLDALIAALLEGIDPNEMLLLVTSDHGNLEDLTTRGHTRNAVPFVAYGDGAHRFAAMRSLEDVTPAIVAFLEESVSAEKT